jgi:membrane-associated phospholipid phosphatase
MRKGFLWRCDMEIEILNAIQTIRNPVLDFLMPIISNCFYLFIVLDAVLLFRKKTRKAGIIILIAILLDLLICNGILKNIFQRTRPFDVNTVIQLLVAKPRDYSFPSAHTSFSFATVTALFFSGALKKWRVPLLVLACLIAFSRMYLYVHYPTDILGGLLTGIFCGWAAYKIVQTRFMQEKIARITQ